MRIGVMLLLFCAFVYATEVFAPIEEVQTYDKAKVRLRQKLFYDPLLSKDKTLSCFSCHNVYGAERKPVSDGVDGAKGTFNSPSVFNAKFNFYQFWDARAKDLHEQLDGPIHSDVEMASSAELIEKRLKNSREYVELFAKVYGKPPSYALLKDAIVAFEKTLVTPALFDAYLKGEKALTPEQKKGLEIFKSYGCVSCHNGKNLGGNSLQEFGVVIPRKFDDNTTGKVLKVPSLRNVTQTAPYFHDGSEENLSEAVRKMGYHNLGTILSEEEIAHIIAFLKTLEGRLPATWTPDE